MCEEINLSQGKSADNRTSSELVRGKVVNFHLNLKYLSMLYCCFRSFEVIKWKCNIHVCIIYHSLR